ncbi:hypothetical protein [Dyadobacter sp. Leaf189]|uniref:hypothetical protein n=1 Tax=Dyadobacter sp. Leaf189 TaxID=1736295 RepID=UPI0012F829D1|nr:hypothetical protein [Dyadobacter sp. Leaf189]
MPNSDSSDFVGLFIVKCFQAVRVHTTREMEGSLIKVKLADGKIVGISSLENDNFFYPVGEFEKLEKGEDSDD